MCVIINVSEVEFIRKNYQKFGTPHEYFNEEATNNKKIIKDVTINSELNLDEDDDELQSLKL